MSDYLQDRRRNRDLETTVFQYLAACVFLWLLTGFWQLQVRDPELYEQRAASNSIKSLPTPAPRGKILDREGRVLVNNSHTYRAMVTRKGVSLEHAPIVADGLGMPLDRLETRLRDLAGSPHPDYHRIVLKEHLSTSEVAFLEAHQTELPEYELIRSQRRLYPGSGLAAHVVGYVGEISEDELNQEEFLMYEPGAEVGKAGLERQYNDALTGKDGSRLVLVDSRSRRVRDLDVVNAKPGSTLRVTLDLDLQVVAELAMQGRRGAVVALDPRNGEVLAMVSAPTFDSNGFVNGMSAQRWRELISDPDKPMFHRAIQARLAPGSIFKPVMALAALAEGIVDPRFQVHCSGGATFYDRYFRCHRAAGHGWMNMEQALAQSCDVYFYTIGKELGIDRIADYARLVGFGEPTGIDLPHEAAGLVPTETWKVRLFRDRWWPGETISVSIGQGALETTPLQAAYAIGGIAMGGVWHQPHLLPYEERRAVDPGFTPPEPHRFDVKPSILRTIQRGMWAAVNDGGTGGGAALPGYDVCGKTGTAQRVSRETAQATDDRRLLDDGWFVAFAPCKSPEIVLAVLYENGEHGSWAAPIARDVIKAYFDKRRRPPSSETWSAQAAPPPAAPAAARSAATGVARP